MSQQGVLDCLKESPLTAKEIQIKLGLAFPSVNTSLNSMLKFGDIKIVDYVRPNECRKRVRLYAIR